MTAWWLLICSLIACEAFRSLHPDANNSRRLTSRTALTMQSNRFNDYNKPIVLIGCSSSGNELRRAAAHLISSDDVQPLYTVDDSGEFHWDGEELLRTFDSEGCKWSAVVIDFSDVVSNPVGSKLDTKLETCYKELVQRLYEDKEALCVYINVDPGGSGMSDRAQAQKDRLEEKLFIKFSDYEVCIKDEGSKIDSWSHIEWELRRIISRARLVPPIPGDTDISANTAHLTMGEHTFFLSLTFPEISQVEPYVNAMCLDVDAMEYRTDLLRCRDSRFDVIYGMQELRRFCRPHVVRVPALPYCGMLLEDVMPIVYTVRTQNQAGTYPDDTEGIGRMFDLLGWGLRAGVEVLDVESGWDQSKTDDLLTLAKTRYTCQILGSYHVVGKEISLEDSVALFQQCAFDGRAHAAKVVLSINTDDKDRMAYEAAMIASSLATPGKLPVIPNISLILGEVGKFSRVLNFPFTPVTHESLPFKAAPGQMSASEIMTARLLTKLLTPKVYCILGHNIAYSVSPQMHGTAFAATRLPHKYVRADVPSVEDFVTSDIFQSDDFGGCSVTIPHKQAIMPHLDILSEAVQSIGSCNTVVVVNEIDQDGSAFKRTLYGDNTDWKGIYNPLNRMFGGELNSGSDFALILGAGGTARAAAYVARKLGLHRIYYNRTPSKAQDLVDDFGGVLAESLEDMPSDADGNSVRKLLEDADGDLRLVISTLPAAAKVVLPEWMVNERPVIFDVNYKPYNTDLLLQAEKAGCKVVRGSEMLWEQGIGQFEAWTKRTAPYSVMKQIVLSNCLPEAEDAA